jgi:hypothetical protein
MDRAARIARNIMAELHAFNPAFERRLEALLRDELAAAVNDQLSFRFPEEEEKK